MRAARHVRGLGLELALERPDEGREEIKEQPVAFHHDVAQIVLHQRAEHDGPHTLFLSGSVYPADGLLRLVNARHKWQSHRPKFEPIELCQEAVAERLRGDASLIGHEESGSAAHGSNSIPS